MPNQHDRPAVFSDTGGAAGAGLPAGHQPLQSVGTHGGMDAHENHDAVRLHLAQRVAYLEARVKRLEPENDLLRTAILINTAETNRLMKFYLTFKCWNDNGCPVGDKTHGALMAAYAEAGAM